MYRKCSRTAMDALRQNAVSGAIMVKLGTIGPSTDAGTSLLNYSNYQLRIEAIDIWLRSKNKPIRLIDLIQVRKTTRLLSTSAG